MVFSSLIFLYAFLPACLLFYLAAGSMKAKNTVLLIFSLFFYAWGEPIWVVLMIITGIMIHWAGLRIDR
ncbi:MAG: MBOAT family protein, partial [Clostridiaceae bacterium]|nr:MBOAT family protein [Clostridiaceae bacterium]